MRRTNNIPAPTAMTDADDAKRKTPRGKSQAQRNGVESQVDLVDLATKPYQERSTGHRGEGEDEADIGVGKAEFLPNIQTEQSHEVAAAQGPQTGQQRTEGKVSPVLVIQAQVSHCPIQDTGQERYERIRRVRMTERHPGAAAPGYPRRSRPPSPGCRPPATTSPPWSVLAPQWCYRRQGARRS